MMLRADLLSFPLVESMDCFDGSLVLTNELGKTFIDATVFAGMDTEKGRVEGNKVICYEKDQKEEERENERWKEVWE